MQPRQIAKAFKPSFPQLAGYTSLSLAILVTTHFFLNEIAASREDEGQILPLIQTNIDTFSQSLNTNQLTSTLTLGLFWGAVGTAMYFLVIAIGHFIADTEHLVVEELTYVKPNPQTIWRQRINTAGRVFARLGVGIMMLFFVVIGIQFVLPLAVQFFDVFVMNMRSMQAIINAVTAMFSLVGVMYLVGSCIRLILSRSN